MFSGQDAGDELPQEEAETVFPGQAAASGNTAPPFTKTSAEDSSAEVDSVGLTILLIFLEKPLRGAAAGSFFVGMRSGGSAVPGKEGRSAGGRQRYARRPANEKSFSTSPQSPAV